MEVNSELKVYKTVCLLYDADSWILSKAYMLIVCELMVIPRMLKTRNQKIREKLSVKGDNRREAVRCIAVFSKRGYNKNSKTYKGDKVSLMRLPNE